MIRERRESTIFSDMMDCVEQIEIEVDRLDDLALEGDLNLDDSFKAALKALHQAVDHARSEVNYLQKQASADESG